MKNIKMFDDFVNENIENLYQNMTPKDAINKAKIEYDNATKTQNIGLANKIAGNLKTYLDSIDYNWKQDPYALEILSDFVE